ncbi:MAG: hypothetical protein R3224_09000 [Balneolaceae bacterium]|nr:hypothetical protein [Balneolaceae bacterium]
MLTGGFNDDVWDEHRWEAYLNEIEKKSDQLRKFIAPDPTGNTPRWITLLQENRDELDAVDAYIEEELQIEEAYFPEEPEEGEEEEWNDRIEEDFDDFLFEELDEEFLFDDEEFDDFDAGEEWKELTEDYARSDYGSIETLEIYNEARELAAYILQWAEGIHPKYHSEEYNDFIGNVLKIGAKLAGGYSFGFELEFLGANIAYTKKALQRANTGLVLLSEHLEGMPFLSGEEYLYLHERLFELRNEIGIYVQELRALFYRGFE